MSLTLLGAGPSAGGALGIVTDGLVLNLDAGNTSSYPGTGTDWFDLSPEGNDATLINGPAFDSANGGSIVFDGANDYCKFSSNKSTSNMTISAWCYPTAVGSAWQKILIFPYGVSSWTPPYYSYQLVIYQNKFGVGFNVDNLYTNGHLDDIDTAVNNIWYNVVGTFNSGIIKIYVNGSLKATKDVTPNGTSIVYTSRTDAILGADAEYFISELFTGKIANVLTYSRTLSSDEIDQNYNAIKSRFGL